MNAHMRSAHRSDVASAEAHKSVACRQCVRGEMVLAVPSSSVYEAVTDFAAAPNIFSNVATSHVSRTVRNFSYCVLLPCSLLVLSVCVCLCTG